MIASVKPHVGDAGAVAHKQDVADTQIGNKPYSPPPGERREGATMATREPCTICTPGCWSRRPTRAGEAKERRE